MTKQCEALGTGTRKKLSNWLAHEHHQSNTVRDILSPPFPSGGCTALQKVSSFSVIVYVFAAAMDSLVNYTALFCLKTLLLMLMQLISEPGSGVTQGVTSAQDSWLAAIRLPPASPFDNFLKAAGC